MQGDRRQTGLPDQPGEPLGDVLGVQDLAVLAGEHQAGVDPRRPPGQALLQLPDAMGLERGGGERVEGELPAAGGGLGLGHHHRPLVDDHDGLDDGEPAGRGLQVDRSPGQAEQLAAAHPGGGEQQPHRGQAILACGRQEGAEFFGRPGAPLLAGHTRRVGGVGDIASDQPHRTASLSALCSSTWTWRTLLGLSPPRPSRRPWCARSL
jgi:hypothetical protein